jgi:hypothetical protein
MISSARTRASGDSDRQVVVIVLISSMFPVAVTSHHLDRRRLSTSCSSYDAPEHSRIPISMSSGCTLSPFGFGCCSHFRSDALRNGSNTAVKRCRSSDAANQSSTTWISLASAGHDGGSGAGLKAAGAATAGTAATAPTVVPNNARSRPSRLGFRLQGSLKARYSAPSPRAAGLASRA